ncbi:hypothetical protein NQ315_014645 [Exocentrus adspersus]|uniref:Uncharacterized protein n=1 Tax=Exocentrus adspersus TaxID=1586481 RepID=A0AAV8VQZ8_9CUCU|nr:hypothetical protein NQ315_014645 [Exocentrus adspersus]
MIVNAAIPINDDVLIVNYEHLGENHDAFSTVNVAVAAYVTTQARLKLYSYLEQLGDRVLEGEWDVPTGAFLGEMTNELDSYGPGSCITEFISSGLENYAHSFFSTKSQQEDVVCKVKGISLNYAASQLG